MGKELLEINNEYHTQHCSIFYKRQQDLRDLLEKKYGINHDIFIKIKNTDPNEIENNLTEYISSKKDLEPLQIEDIISIFESYFDYDYYLNNIEFDIYESSFDIYEHIALFSGNIVRDNLNIEID